MRVVVQGRLKARTYETREGEKRTVFEIEVEEVGPSLKFATAKVNRTSRQGGGGGYSGAAVRAAARRAAQLARWRPSPWATPAAGSRRRRRSCRRGRARPATTRGARPASPPTSPRSDPHRPHPSTTPTIPASQPGF